MKVGTITLTVMLLACGHSAPRQQDGPQVANAKATITPPVSPASGPACPMALPGTTLAFAPTSGGGSILFAAKQDDALQDLRKRVQRLATEHNRASHRLAMLDVPHRAEMVPVPGGARLDLVTGIGNDTLELQRSIETNTSSMLEAQCREAN